VSIPRLNPIKSVASTNSAISPFLGSHYDVFPFFLMPKPWDSLHYRYLFYVFVIFFYFFELHPY
ncbi:unnamed protein product, partial [Arabidopsis halleri]